MRRITNITLDNFRAYIHQIEIKIPAGENLLVYGENGSGKSSLYKALHYFLASSVNDSLPFEINHFSGRPEGKISVTYTEVDTNGDLLPGTERTYTKSTDATTTDNDQAFIKTSHRASGFLDYSQLLRVYLNNGKRPNLFGLITELLGNYVPVDVDTRTIRDLIAGIEKECHEAYHRTDYSFLQGKDDFRKLEALFSNLITKLNAEFTPMMSRYFSDMGLEIELVDAKTMFCDPDYIRNVKVKGEVYVKVKHHGNILPNYNDRLNEARLSAIATCLYLSSLKLIAQTNDTRVLFLDDVFIGLDLGNRLPVLEIVKQEFSDFQRIITTYDKSWYHQAKEILSDDEAWKFYEMYEGEVCDAEGNKYVNPILVAPESYYGKACSYFSEKEHPDYPASANYLRKSFEELLQIKIYDKAIRDENFDIIPAFKLTKLVSACKVFVLQMPDYIVPSSIIGNQLAELSNLLHPLLHPLSHYVPDIPTYKSELRRAIRIYDTLSKELAHADYQTHCRVVCEKDQKLEFIVKGISGWWNKYTLRLNENLYRYDNNKGGQSFSLCEIRALKIEGMTNGGVVESQQINNNDALAKIMVYSSLQDCYNKIIYYICNEEHKTDIVSEAIEDMFIFPKENNTKQSLRQVLLSII